MALSKIVVIKFNGTALPMLTAQTLTDGAGKPDSRQEPTGRKVASDFRSTDIKPLIISLLDAGYSMVSCRSDTTSDGRGAVKVVLTDDTTDTRRLPDEVREAVWALSARVNVVSVWENPGGCLSLVCVPHKHGDSNRPTRWLARAQVYPRRIAFNATENPKWRQAQPRRQNDTR